jgi:hypothetical protein
VVNLVVATPGRLLISWGAATYLDHVEILVWMKLIACWTWVYSQVKRIVRATPPKESRRRCCSPRLRRTLSTYRAMDVPANQGGDGQRRVAKRGGPESLSGQQPAALQGVKNLLQ